MWRWKTPLLQDEVHALPHSLKESQAGKGPCEVGVPTLKKKKTSSSGGQRAGGSSWGFM
jgi:hypothetical protein